MRFCRSSGEWHSRGASAAALMSRESKVVGSVRGVVWMSKREKRSERAKDWLGSSRARCVRTPGCHRGRERTTTLVSEVEDDADSHNGFMAGGSVSSDAEQATVNETKAQIEGRRRRRARTEQQGPTTQIPCCFQKVTLRHPTKVRRMIKATSRCPALS